MMETRTMESFPPNENPFHHDSYRMGTYLGKNVCIMYEKHNTETQPYIVVVNTETGERMSIRFNNEQTSMYAG